MVQGTDGGVVDRSQRLQQFLIGAIQEDEIAVVDGEDDVGMLDFVFVVLAKAGQALRIERGADLARPLAAVEGRDGAVEIAVAHQLDQDVGGVAALGHGDVEMLDPLADVGDDFCELRLAVRAVAVGEHPHRRVVFPDAVDPAGEDDIRRRTRSSEIRR